MIKLISGDFTLDAAKGDAPRRTISGTAVPYNVPATVSDGTAVIFRPGSLPVEGKAPRLFMYHDASMPVGVVTERVDTGTVWMPFHFSGRWQGEDMLKYYPKGAAHVVRGEAVNTATTYGYDSITMMQETKTTVYDIERA